MPAEDSTTSATASLPMAIGILALPLATSEEVRLEARLDLALLAYKLGYFMVDIIELPQRSPARRHAWIEAVARRVGADAFVVAGPVDRAWLGGLAQRRGMAIVTGRPQS